MTAPSILTYHYYADGKRSSLDVSASGGFTQAALFSYAYRADGPVQWQQINDTNVWSGNANAGVTTLAMTYDNTGRLTQRTESGVGANSAAITAAYDANGFATTKNYPGGTLGAAEYDATGAPLGWAAGPGLNKLGYTVRGELSSITPSAPLQQATTTKFANGVGIGASTCWCMGSVNPYKTFDPAMGVIVATSNQPPGIMPLSSSSTTFDAAGRITMEQSEQMDNNGNDTVAISAGRTYDAENHITGETYQASVKSTQPGAPNAQTSYIWGATGHPIAIGSAVWSEAPEPTLNYDTLHWDGDQLLFTTNPSGIVDDIKVGDLADITPSNGILFYDRGFGSDVSFCHSGSSAGGTGSASPYGRYMGRAAGIEETSPCGTMPGQPAPMAWSGDPNGKIDGVGVGNGDILANPHGDGISDGFNTIQGTRSFSSTAGVWTAPDAFSGTVHDPATQKSYMWNENNGISYSDPTGYAAMFIDADLWGDQIEDTSQDGTAEKSFDLLANVANGTNSSAPISEPNHSLDEVDQVALAESNAYHDKSVREHVEYGGAVACEKGSSDCIGLVSSDSGNHRENDEGDVGGEVDVTKVTVPKGYHIVAYWHTHWGGPESENFSDNDAEFSMDMRKPLYMASPSGNLLRTTGYLGATFYHGPGEIILCYQCVH